MLGRPGCSSPGAGAARLARLCACMRVATIQMGLVSSTLPIPATAATTRDSATVMLALRRSTGCLPPAPPPPAAAARRSTAICRSTLYLQAPAAGGGVGAIVVLCKPAVLHCCALLCWQARQGGRGIPATKPCPASHCPDSLPCSPRPALTGRNRCPGKRLCQSGLPPALRRARPTRPSAQSAAGGSGVGGGRGGMVAVRFGSGGRGACRTKAECQDACGWHSVFVCLFEPQTTLPRGRLVACGTSARSCAVPRRAGLCGAPLPLPLLPPSTSCPSCSRRERVACRTLTCRDSGRQQQGALRKPPPARRAACAAAHAHHTGVLYCGASSSHRHQRVSGDGGHNACSGMRQAGATHVRCQASREMIERHAWRKQRHATHRQWRRRRPPPPHQRACCPK